AVSCSGEATGGVGSDFPIHGGRRLAVEPSHLDGPRRGFTGRSGGHDERQQLADQFVTEVGRLALKRMGRVLAA
ncbi:MAG: hypothetical protein ACXWYG_10775, partial [Aeromicrobium sp.]